MQELHKLAKKLIPLLIGIVIVFAIATAAIGNSAAPPERHWLKFTPAQPTLEGLQIVQCESPQCQKPLLIMQHKTCNKTGCISGSALVQHTADTSLGAWQPHFACVDNTCFWSFRNLDLGKSHNFNRNLLKIIVQYPDRVRSSNLLKLVQPNVFDQPTDIAIAITANDLRVSQSTNQKEPAPSKNGENGLAQFSALVILLLSIGSELPIAYFYFRRLYPTSDKVWFLLYSVLMVHLFSLAIVWVSFPALAAFKTTGVRTAGIAWIVMSLCYGLLVTAYYSIGKQPKKASTWVSGTIGFWLLSVVVSFFCLILDYGISLPLTNDVFLPAAWILPTSEVFIWLYEAWMIYVVNKNSINYRQAILLSFCMNLTSFLLGLGAIAISNYLIKM